ncbi:UV DNA damage repair endonuclease UvsE [Candidatus Gracilibacteria bacterium]|nr:UV DNA damage repair endonuclease UvsE [Candidatus Gracilibacteria bacterium]
MTKQTYLSEEANDDPYLSATTARFAVKVLGKPELKSNDSRRWQSEPHLRVSLDYVAAIFAYLSDQRITMYRLSSELAPYVSHPDLPQFHHQIEECANELRTLGAQARAQSLRLSFHPAQYIVLNSPDPRLVERSIWDLRCQAEILDRMELGPEAVLVVHVGGTYGNRELGRQRWIETYQRLPEPVRRRLTLENDDVRYSAADVLAIHEHTGVPLIFDYLHFWCFNPEHLDLAPTFQRFMASWPTEMRPKIHFSSPRTEMREVKQRNRNTGKLEAALRPPVWAGHADYINPFEFITFMRSVPHADFDVMLEAKAKDLALLRLRRDLANYAPDVAPLFAANGPQSEEEEPELISVSLGEE